MSPRVGQAVGQAGAVLGVGPQTVAAQSGDNNDVMFYGIYCKFSPKKVKRPFNVPEKMLSESGRIDYI